MHQWLMAITKKITSAIVASVLVVTTVVTFAFKAGNDSKPESAKRFATWYYTGTTVAGITDGSLWTLSNPNDPSCSALARPLPCQFSFPSTVTDAASIEQYFEDEYANDTDLIVADSPSKRDIP